MYIPIFWKSTSIVGSAAVESGDIVGGIGFRRARAHEGRSDPYSGAIKGFGFDRFEDI
jgi:hypothetical protein